MPTSEILITSDWMLYWWVARHMLVLPSPVFFQFPFGCISQGQSPLRLCWQQQAFQGNSPFCVTWELWHGNTFARWIFTQPSPILCPVLSPAQREDELRCGMGLALYKEIQIYSFSLPSSAEGVNLLLKEKKGPGPAWLWFARLHSLQWWCGSSAVGCTRVGFSNTRNCCVSPL